LVIVILIQNPKGGGLSSEFGGGGSQMFGVQKTGDILEQLSWGFFAFLLIAALSTAVLARIDANEGDVNSDVNVESSVAVPSAAPATAPATAPTAVPAGTPTPSQSPATLPAATPAPASKK
jgi:preprotein translocase subunit SecG